MVITPRQHEIEGCRKIGYEERFMIDESDAIDTQTGLTCGAEHITITSALERWPYRLHNVEKFTIEIERHGQKSVIDCESLTSHQKDLLWPGIVETLSRKSRKFFYRDNDARRNTHISSFGDFHSLENDSGDEVRRRSSSANSRSSAGSTHEQFQVEDYRHHGLSDIRKCKRVKAPRTFPEPIANEVEVTKLLTIGSEAEVSDFLGQCLKEMQQDICKLIAKPWIKAINPNKQTNHPYAKGSEKAPPWWPPTTPVGVEGPVKGKVRHQEPDHLLKDERITLLRHIVLIIAQPFAVKQPPMHDIDITRLEEITNLAIGSKLDSEGGRMKRRAVNEFFKLAKQYERFANGEIDGSTSITVVSFHDQSTAKSPGSGSGEDPKAIEANDYRYNNPDFLSNGLMGTSRSSASDVPHVQGFFHGQPGENGVPAGTSHYRQQFHAFPSQQQTVEGQLSYGNSSSNPPHASATLARLPSNYQSPNSFLQTHSRRSPWLSNTAPSPSCSPNLALNSQDVHNNSLPYGSFQDTLHLPVNMNVVRTPYVPQSPSMQLPAANLQPHQVLGDAVQSPSRDLRVCNHGDLNQYPQQIHGFQLLNGQDYNDSSIKEDPIRANCGARGGYSFDQIAGESNHHSSIR